MKYWESKEFRAEQSFWYGILKDSGFSDAEKIVRDEIILTIPSSNVYRAHWAAGVAAREDKQEFYDRFSCLLNQEKFENVVDEIVMTRLSEGVPVKNIAAELKTLGHKHHRITVRRIAQRYEVKWNLKILKSWKRKPQHQRTP